MAADARGHGPDGDEFDPGADKPELDPYTPNALVTIVGVRGDDGELRAATTMTMTMEALHADVVEREIRGRAADERLNIVDKIAAERLKPVDYAVYRIMREEAHMLHISRSTAKDLTVDQTTLAKVIQERLDYQHGQGAYMAMNRVRDVLGKDAGIGEVDLSPKAEARLRMGRDEAVDAGLAAKPKARNTEKGAELY